MDPSEDAASGSSAHATATGFVSSPSASASISTRSTNTAGRSSRGDALALAPSRVVADARWRRASRPRRRDEGVPNAAARASGVASARIVRGVHLSPGR
eukprot:31071-Pelagococcus_subviridis.AAC.20